MERQQAIVAVAVLLATVVGAGCMGPQEDPSNTVQETETTPGETVQAGANPTEVTETPTVIGTTTAEGTQNATGGTTAETTTDGEGTG